MRPKAILVMGIRNYDCRSFINYRAIKLKGFENMGFMGNSKILACTSLDGDFIYTTQKFILTLLN